MTRLSAVPSGDPLTDSHRLLLHETDDVPFLAWTTRPLPRAAVRRVVAASITLALIAVLIPVYRLQSLSWPEATGSATVFVLAGMILGWLVWRRQLHSTAHHGSLRGLFDHALNAAGFSLLWTSSYTLFVYLVRPDALSAFFDDGAVWQVTWGVLIYVIVVQAARAHVRVQDREQAAEHAELQALRAQLDPHFLFNTLNALTQLAREDPDATQHALERFGELMRYVLHSGRRASGADTSLEDEINFVRHYLALQRLRLGERLRVVEDLDPEALELAVPPLLLQPLVENAVRHGLAPRRDGGTLRFIATVQNDELTIAIADDGSGATVDAWRRPKGLGLESVVRQLEARFRTDARLEIATAPNHGFTARVTVPAQLPRGAGP